MVTYEKQRIKYVKALNVLLDGIDYYKGNLYLTDSLLDAIGEIEDVSELKSMMLHVLGTYIADYREIEV